LYAHLEEGEEVTRDHAAPSLDTGVPPILPTPLPSSCVGLASPIIATLYLHGRIFLTAWSMMQGARVAFVRARHASPLQHIASVGLYRPALPYSYARARPLPGHSRPCWSADSMGPQGPHSCGRASPSSSPCGQARRSSPHEG